MNATLEVIKEIIELWQLGEYSEDTAIQKITQEIELHKLEKQGTDKISIQINKEKIRKSVKEDLIVYVMGRYIEKYEPTNSDTEALLDRIIDLTIKETLREMETNMKGNRIGGNLSGEGSIPSTSINKKEGE